MIQVLPQSQYIHMMGESFGIMVSMMSMVMAESPGSQAEELAPAFLFFCSTRYAGMFTHSMAWPAWVKKQRNYWLFPIYC